MTKTYFSLLLIMCLSISAFAVKQDVWSAANDAYTDKRYDDALALYGKLLDKNTEHAALLYNMGNVYYRKNEIAEAVWCYEKAFSLNNKLLKASENKVVAQQRIPNAIKSRSDIFFVEWWHGLTTYKMSNTWSFLCVLCSIGTIALLLLRKRRVLPIQLFVFMPVFIVAFLIMALLSGNNEALKGKAVVFGMAAPLLNAPGQYKNQVIIPQATVVNLKQTQGQWLLVQLPDARVGWMNIDDLKALSLKKI